MYYEYTKQSKGKGKNMTTCEKIKVRACSIICSAHPEWGTFGVMEDRGSYYEIFNRGRRVLDKDEANKFWEVVENKRG